ncbi:MAG TPA: SDR family oxidoreductase, partial [Alphaproteobacteria bacterium]|nr:SDR family oxidoreductase [Alphaproteobacteria bacterium]
MQFDFMDKRVLVTGGTRGIGRATVEAFLEAGARVAVNGRTAESTAAAVATLGDNKRLSAVPGDIATVAGCEAAVAGALHALGGLDVLINNAGVFKRGPMAECDEGVWTSIIDTNVKGTYFCCRAALAALKAATGTIVNVA